MSIKVACVRLVTSDEQEIAREHEVERAKAWIRFYETPRSRAMRLYAEEYRNFMVRESGQRGHVPPEADVPECSYLLGAGVTKTLDGDPAN